jgi:D-amino-acid oxidase
MSSADAVVVGAGVSGLTTAISLLEAGLTTRVVTAALPAQTTSVAAGAIWGPVRSGPPDRIYEWSRTGLSVLSDLASVPEAGIRQVSGIEVAAGEASPAPWTDLLPDLRMLGPSEVPAGFASGWGYTAPVVNLPRYLEYLRSRFLGAGGSLTVAPVRSLTSGENLADAPVVVNCSGIGARELVPDPAVYPVRGQVVVVENPGIDQWYIDHSEHGADYVYLFPHEDVVVLGGTAETGAWDYAPRPDVRERILRDCAQVDPRVREAKVVDERVGLRPCRDQVRLEAERLPGGRMLWHNYGHGGAGVTLSWGCAREVTTAIVRGARGR